MAEAGVSDSWSSQIQCRYFLHGMCRRGDACKYSHDLNSKPNNICKFYLEGACSYGRQCRYDHVKPKTPVTSLTPDTSTRHSVPRNNSKANPLLMARAPAPLIMAQESTNHTSRMVPLKARKNTLADCSFGEDSPASPCSMNPADWIKAAEFVPGKMWKSSASPSTYLAAVQSGVESSDPPESQEEIDYFPYLTDEEKSRELCPYSMQGVCRYGENCVYMHGDMCDFCGKPALHPTNAELRSEHTNECIKQHETDMELSFAIANSREKTCGVCMEVVMEKANKSEQRFGLLSNCNHVFCLTCIRKWRSAKQFENKIVRSCPECRVKSDFVTPSKYWVEERKDKEALIESYKKALSEKPCKYFDQGRGECPFNANCFYLHAYPDGRLASPKPIRRRRRHNAEGNLDFVQQIILWDFLEEHRRQLTLEIDLEDTLEELLSSAGFWDTSSDDSDFSDYS